MEASHSLLIGAGMLLMLIIPKVAIQIRDKFREMELLKGKTAES